MLDYDPQKPIAVFVGPSLAGVQTASLLEANYYPPVRMGNIYRLLGAGVRRIVIFDGLFHGPASVWHREILEALDSEIQIIGAASMGALRAAELYPFGMVGHGTIFEWYRDGIIDGDDEVALLHGDETVGFQPLSEPLVNLRYNLQQATRRGIISSPQSEELIEYLKTLYYPERSYQTLLSCKVVTSWPHEIQSRLRQFIQQEARDLKKQDALAALRACAANAQTENALECVASSFHPQNLYYQLASYQHRGFLHPTGKFVSGKALLDIVAKDATLHNAYRAGLIKNFFLLQWAKQNVVQYPTEFYEAYRVEWWEAQRNPGNAQWLRLNGLTERECHVELAARALLQWLIEQGPAHFGLTFSHYAQLFKGLRPKLRTQDNADDKARALWVEAVESCYLAAWARENGIACPENTVAAFTEKWEASYRVDDRTQWLYNIGLDEQCYRLVLAEQALCAWLIKKGPLYFGYISWSFEIALLKELQITGQTAQLIAALV